MSQRDQVLLRNAAFLGPAGSQGPAGPTGLVVVDAQNNAATLTNVSAATDFSLSKDVGSGYPTLNKILRVTSFGRWSTGAAQSLTFTQKIGGTSIAVPAIALGGVNNGWWKCVTEIYFTAVGAGGSAQINTHFTFSATGTTSSNLFSKSLGATAIDTTAAQAVKMNVASTVGNNTVNEDAQIIESLS